MDFSSILDSSRQVFEEEDDADRHRFERMLRGKIDLPTSENGIYLARTVAPILTKALAEVSTALLFCEYKCINITWKRCYIGLYYYYSPRITQLQYHDQ